MVIQEVPGHDNFSNLDLSLPPGSGGEIEIPLEDPEINIPELGEGDLYIYIRSFSSVWRLIGRLNFF